MFCRGAMVQLCVVPRIPYLTPIRPLEGQVVIVVLARFASCALVVCS
jgi:hypothetical protein